MESQLPPVWLRSSESTFEIVVVGASAGGLPALWSIFSELAHTFGGAILVAHHRGTARIEPYRALFERRTRLRVVEAVHGERPARGSIYLAPTGCHLEVAADGTIYTGHTVRHHTVRPSADLLFTSVAASYGPRAVAVVLSGYGRDGSAGVCAVRDRGGFVISQDSASSEVLGMPTSAVETRRVDIVLPLRHIAFALTTLFSTPN
jgi:two-component system, chemotaxis family, protein-glutamate methylesterase/glutaminase